MKILCIIVFSLLFLQVIAIDYSAGNCLEFDGVDDFVAINNAVSMLSDYTVELWFNTSVTNQTMDLLSGTVSSNHGILFEFTTANELRVLHRNPPGSTGGNNIYATGTYNDGEWHHVALVRYDDYIDLHIDGEYIIDSSPVTDFNDPLDILIGKLKPNSSERFYSGMIDEVRIWNVELSEEEIQQNMHLALNGDEPGLEAYWQFNETSGTTAYDSAGSNHGTLNNMTNDDWVQSSVPIFSNPDGSGTVGDPYQIANLGNLIWISINQNVWSDHFIQTVNIDATDTISLNDGEGLSMIGNYYVNFTGTYDGQGFLIDNLYINFPDEDVGLFGEIDGAEISNLGITNASVNGDWDVGVLIGRSNNSNIINCFSTGQINSPGGIGGLIGQSYNSTISNCYAIVNITTEEQSGGFMGNTFNDVITNCYCAGNITGISEIGGFIGMDNSSTTINNCFWDIESSGQSTSVGGIGKTTVEMKTGSTFTSAGWDFLYETANGIDDYWGIFSELNSGYPILSGFFTILPSTITTIPAIQVMETKLKIGGNATQDGNSTITAKGLCWSTTPNPTTSSNFTDVGSGIVEFYSTLTGLNAITQYFYRAYATNSWGTAYGEEYHIIPENIAGFCLEFDGIDDHVLIDSNPELRPANNFTVEAWIKPATLSGIQGIIQHDENGGGNDGYIMQMIDDKIRFGPLNGGAFQSVQSTGSVILNQWNHVAGVYDNSMMKAYLNGEETTLQGTGDVVYQVLDHLNIGRRGGTDSPNTQMYTGKIDGIRFWNVVRSATEINENKDIYISPDEAGLVGYWSFNESTGTRLYDVVNDYHGTLQNMDDIDWAVSDAPIGRELPSVQTTEISNITNNSAESGGNVTNEGIAEVTAYGVCWSTSPNPTIADFYTTDGSGESSFASYLTGLNSSTEYYYRAYAINSYGTNYGEEFSFFTTPTGSGTEIDPYLITNLDDLRALSGNDNIWLSYFIQTADIDATDTQNWHNGAGFVPIGTDQTDSFSGIYDGQGFEIDGLYINRPNGALFGYVYNGIVHNLGLTNVDLHQCTGSLADEFEVWGVEDNIANCYSTGGISSSSIDNVGGLVGTLIGFTEIVNCYSSANVIGLDRTGGLIGQVLSGYETIDDCYSTGDVQGNEYVGGLFGFSETSGTDERYNNLYATGNVQGNSFVGGLVGYTRRDIGSSYSVGSVSGNSDTGGLIGGLHYQADVIDSFWDTETSGQTTSAGGTGYTTAQMTDLSTWVINGWDLVDETANGTDDTWSINQIVNGGYPFLSWQNLASMNDYHPEGSGTSGEPYQIGSLMNLLWLSQHISEYDKDYIQTNDIDASQVQNWINGTGFIPIGSSTNSFTGNYDGQGYIIDNLYIHSNDFENEGCGLFGYINGAEISDLGLTNVDFNVDETYFIGALAGNAENYSLISNCYSSVNINGQGSAGGLVGRNTDYSTIINCSSSGSLNNVGNNGGLVSINTDFSSIINCSSSVDITDSNCNSTGGFASENGSNSSIENSLCTGTVNGSSKIGGFIGRTVLASISNCYSHSPVPASSGPFVGGFVGEASSSTIQNCYSNGSIGSGSYIGGFLGLSSSSTFIDCFWDTETSGQSNGIPGGSQSGVTGKTSTEMQNISTYTDITTTGLDTPWDFFANPYDDAANDDFWGINYEENNGYPFLMMQGLENQSMPYGSGTEADPYRITTLADLEWLSTTDSVWMDNYYFIQTADIDASDTQNWNNGKGFRPIGTSFSNFFYGNYDGQGFNIADLYINRPDEDFVGLFGAFDQAEYIKNLHLLNIQIIGNSHVGGVIGWLASNVENCSISGIISSNSNSGGAFGYVERGEIINITNNAEINGLNAGGIAGSILEADFNNCFNYGNVIGSDFAGGIAGFSSAGVLTNCNNYAEINGLDHVGGLVGRFTKGTIIESSFNSGNIIGETCVGGVVGEIYISGPTSIDGNISNCYTTGDVSGLEDTGGFIGNCSIDYVIEHSYCTGIVSGNTNTGGFIGSNSSTSIQSCFWDMETSGQTTSSAGIGLMTNEMHDILFYLANSWDFQSETINGTNDIWGMNPAENDGYPFLSWQGNTHTAQTEFSPSGSGTDIDPYQIGSLENLYWLSNTSIIRRTTSIWDKHFIQTADIDAGDTQYWNSGEGFSPIGNAATCFSGNYDGQTLEINGLTIKRPNSNYQGLFGYGAGASIANVRLTDINIQGDFSVGGVVSGVTSSSISYCSVNGTVIGNDSVGGIIGGGQWDFNVNSCFNSSNVSASTSFAGGIIGYIFAGEHQILNCCNTGSISSYDSVGGLIGWSEVADNQIMNSYNTGSISSNNSAGGLIGNSLDQDIFISNCYSVGSVTADSYCGGLIGPNMSYTAENCFWDIETSGQQNGTPNGSDTGMIGATTTEMQDTFIYLLRNWDFQGETTNGNDDIWGMNSTVNDGYPFLFWQGYTHTAQTDFTPAGSGTVAEPYQIEKLGNLHWLSNNSSVWDKYFIQTSDINASDTQYWENGEGFSPTGNTTTLFTGIYDGQGYGIDGIMINRPTSDNQGFFGKCNDAEISNLNLNNVEITGNSYVGGLAGYLDNLNQIQYCSSNGNISSNNVAGGLIGFIDNRNNVFKSFSSGNVNAAFNDAGGLIGCIRSPDNDIQNCYSKSDVNGDTNVGGFTGISHMDLSFVFYCFCEGSVSGNWNIGGFIGSNLLDDTYSGCFWNMETSGQQYGIGDGHSGGIIGISTSEMQTQSTFTNAGWDFAYETANGTDDIWGMNGVDNEGYPFLMWQGYEVGIDTPQNVAIQIIGTEVHITWDEVAGANSYKVFAADSPDGTFIDVTGEGSFEEVRIQALSTPSKVSNRDNLSKRNRKSGVISSSLLDKLSITKINRTTQTWTAPASSSKKFYYVQASTE